MPYDNRLIPITYSLLQSALSFLGIASIINSQPINAFDYTDEINIINYKVPNEYNLNLSPTEKAKIYYKIFNAANKYLNYKNLQADYSKYNINPSYRYPNSTLFELIKNSTDEDLIDKIKYFVLENKEKNTLNMVIDPIHKNNIFHILILLNKPIDIFDKIYNILEDYNGPYLIRKLKNTIELTPIELALTKILELHLKLNYNNSNKISLYQHQITKSYNKQVEILETVR